MCMQILKQLEINGLPSQLCLQSCGRRIIQEALVWLDGSWASSMSLLPARVYLRLIKWLLEKLVSNGRSRSRPRPWVEIEKVVIMRSKYHGSLYYRLPLHRKSAVLFSHLTSPHLCVSLSHAWFLSRFVAIRWFKFPRPYHTSFPKKGGLLFTRR